MNGEIKQLSSIVCCARKALYDNKDIEFTLNEGVRSIKFVFSSPFSIWGTTEAESVQKWYRICQKRGLRDIKLLIPTATDRRHLLGFANTSQGVIVCFWENGKVSYFSPLWDFGNKSNGWVVIYKEQSGAAMPKDEFTYSNKTEEFKAVLLDICAFAKKINFPYFSNIFHNAYDGMCNFAKIAEHNVPEHIPDAFKGIYYAVDTADVFGAMMSWNDSPPWHAEERGLENEYNDLSDKLLKQLRYHLMYVTNECWQRN